MDASNTSTESAQPSRETRNVRLNNFDLLRLFAASQVVYFHAIENLELKVPPFLAPLSDFLSLFPGVPIFFVISGFLISMSYERSKNLSDYGINRFLRIYPALWVCFLTTLAAITAFGAWNNIKISAAKFLQWVVMQLTVGQFYSPHVVNAAYGVGHTNGSLWTIPVELQFYIAVPLIYYLLRRLKKPLADLLVLLLFVLFYLVQHLYSVYGPAYDKEYETLVILVRVTFLPWIYMFLGGVLLQRNQAWLAAYLRDKGLFWLLGYLVIATAAVHCCNVSLGNYLNVILYVVLAFTVISLAHTKPELSSRILGKNDISYGTYIYHMVIVNIVYQLGYSRDPILLPVVFLLTYAVAYLSWKFIEKPALAAKRHALRPITD